MDYRNKLFTLKTQLKLNHINEVNPDLEAVAEERESKSHLPLLDILKRQIAESTNHFGVFKSEALPEAQKRLNPAIQSNILKSYNNVRQNSLVNPNSQPKAQQQKEVKLRDFEILEKICNLELESIEIQYLKKLYMLHPKNKSCLLYRIQKKQDSNFDGTNYTDTMQSIFYDVYMLPCLIKRYDSNDKLKHTSQEPYDELFIWSLLLYSGNESDLDLARHFWSKSKYPVACCLVGIIAFKTLLGENFVPDDLKDSMQSTIKEFENMIIGVLTRCYESNDMISQDLLILEIEIFHNHTVLELAIRSKSYDIACLSTFQELLTDVWFDKINPCLPNWQIAFPYIFIPCLFLPISFFRSDIVELINLTELDEKSSKLSISIHPTKSKVYEKNSYLPDEFLNLHENIPNKELSYRQINIKLSGLDRIYSYFNAPIVKFLNHLIFYVLFLFLFSGFLLFDYYPDKEVVSTVIRITVYNKTDFIKVTATELVVIICVFIYLTDEIRELIIKKTSDNKIITKIKSFYLDNKWNIFDFFVYFIFFVAFGIRFSPIFGNVFFIGIENCYEVSRVLYCIDLILWYTKVFQLVSCVPFWGPKIIIIKEMVKNLIVYVMLILVFLLPFSVAVESVLNKTQEFSVGVFSSAINRGFWVMFGELLDILDEFSQFQCKETIDQVNSLNETSSITKVCNRTLSSFFLYVGFAFYTVACNLLLFNMIIATFTSTVEDININSNKYFKFIRFAGIKEFSEKMVIPPPFVVIEYIYVLLTYIRGFFTGNYPVKSEIFRIENSDESAKNIYIKFETSNRDKYYDENYKMIKKNNKDEISEIDEMNSFVSNQRVIETFNKLEESFNMFKTWVIDHQNEKYAQINSKLDVLLSKLSN
ncbi:unnamed protein product [Brachionus calyciflorus]|uniref:Uncharacterized protein n=1 Tax=Brachionus calyciflorus TaxID=104777 RepID=A0A813R2S7_9BILA|nr:unnamed protein product [Brachionus calyciflorus]